MRGIVRTVYYNAHEIDPLCTDIIFLHALIEFLSKIYSVAERKKVIHMYETKLLEAPQTRIMKVEEIQKAKQELDDLQLEQMKHNNGIRKKRKRRISDLEKLITTLETAFLEWEAYLIEVERNRLPERKGCLADGQQQIPLALKTILASVATRKSELVAGKLVEGLSASAAVVEKDDAGDDSYPSLL